MFLRPPKKNKYRFIANQIVIFVCGFIILILISIPLSKNIAKRMEVNKEIKDLEGEIAGIENKNNQLDDLVTYLKSDNFAEEQARLNLGLKKPGEEVAVITAPDNPAAAPGDNGPGGNAGNDGRAGNKPQRWYDYFFMR